MAKRLSKDGAAATSLTPKQRGFLLAYAKCGNISVAAKAAKVGRRSHTNWLAEAEYSAAFDDARQEATELLVKEARRRALTGVLKGKWYKGSRCGYEREYSDVLLMFLIKGADPETYRENVHVEHTGELQLIVERLAAARKRVPKND